MLLITLPVEFFAKKNDWNCKADCGLYEKMDIVGPKLHSQCRAYNKKICKKQNDLFAAMKNKKKKEKKKKKYKGDRVVNGLKATSSFPWMVGLLIGGIYTKSHIILIMNVSRKVILI